MEKNELITCAEAAEILRCCANTVKRYVRDRIIPGFRISNKWRVKRADVQSFIDKGGYASPMGPKRRKARTA